MRGPGIIGSDIFLSQGLFYAIIAFLLSVNAVTSGLNEEAKKNEGDLPKIELAQGSTQGLPKSGLKNAIALSAEIVGAEITYYLDHEIVELKDLATTLGAKQINSIKIRFDEKIPYGAYVTILDICSQASVKNIVNVYQVKE